MVEDQAKEVAEKNTLEEAALRAREQIYKQKIMASKRIVQARADAKEAHEKPIDVKAMENAAEKKAAPRKETIEESPLKKKTTFSEDTFEDRCTINVDNFRGLPLYRRPPGGQDSLNQLAKGCTRHRVKHPLAKGLVKFKIKAYYNHYQA